MSVMITGGAGYIGGHTVLAALAAGETVVILDTFATGVRRAVDPRAVLVEGSIADQALVAATIARHGVTEIVHFAGSTVVPESVADPGKYYTNNTAGTLALARTAVAAGVARFVFSSTAAVYGDVTGDAPVAETAPLRPVSPYGWSKLMSEQMLDDIARAHGMGLMILRYFNVAGADPLGRIGQSTPEATHLVKVACEAALGLRPGLTVFGDDWDTPDGTCIRDYIHVSDLADIHLAALAHLRAGGAGDRLNCGYGRGLSVRDIIAAVERATGQPLAHRIGPRRAGDARAVVADPSRLKARLGWQPRHDDIDAIVGHALAWEKTSAAAPPSTE